MVEDMVVVMGVSTAVPEVSTAWDKSNPPTSPGPGPNQVSFSKESLPKTKLHGESGDSQAPWEARWSR